MENGIKNKFAKSNLQVVLLVFLYNLSRDIIRSEAEEDETEAAIDEKVEQCLDSNDSEVHLPQFLHKHKCQQTVQVDQESYNRHWYLLKRQESTICSVQVFTEHNSP